MLHGGTGIVKTCVQESIRHGIAKVNIATSGTYYITAAGAQVDQATSEQQYRLAYEGRFMGRPPAPRSASMP